MELEKKIGYTFQDKKYLETALTHSSFANESKTKIPNNERLEFLGDAVLSIVVSDFLYNNYGMQEGDLTKLRAMLVCEKTLCEFAREIQLGQSIQLGKGEENMGGRNRDALLADAFEALIAAIYLDGGIPDARNFILPFVKRILERDNSIPFHDYKTILQEIIQKNPEEKLYYALVLEEGPDHDKCFHVEVRMNSNVIGRGTGKSKKDAEQKAAKEALELMGQ